MSVSTSSRSIIQTGPRDFSCQKNYRPQQISCHIFLSFYSCEFREFSCKSSHLSCRSQLICHKPPRWKKVKRSPSPTCCRPLNGRCLNLNICVFPLILTRFLSHYCCAATIRNTLRPLRTTLRSRQRAMTTTWRPIWRCSSCINSIRTS